LKPRLLFPDCDGDWRWALSAAELRDTERTGRRFHGEFVASRSAPPWNADALVADLELETLFDAMAGEDDGIHVVSRHELLGASSNDEATIAHRQGVLADAIANRALVRALFGLADAGLRAQKRHHLGTYERSYPDATLRWAVETVEGLLPLLARLHDCAAEAEGHFSSDGWRTFWSAVTRELSPDYLAEVQSWGERLKGRDAEVMSAALGEGNQGADYRLHGLASCQRSWWERFLDRLRPRGLATRDGAFGIHIAPSDENGHRALRELNNRGLRVAAEAIGAGAVHLCDFFAALRVELSFYVGCINLHERLEALGEPTSIPHFDRCERWSLGFEGLCDPCLALRRAAALVGNSFDAKDLSLIVITGANEGGKSTFLRSVGVAQLMAQAGMFAPAERYSSSRCPAIVTHFRREEDAGLRKGKFDEELSRMSEIVDHLEPGTLLLSNESFSSTNEREGSEIARQVVDGLVSARIRIVLVTHLFAFARTLFERRRPDIKFLRADRDGGGRRHFALGEAEPLATGYAGDLYRSVFNADLERDAA
jgi:hypothetical protein